MFQGARNFVPKITAEMEKKMIAEKLNELIRDHYCTVIIGTEKNAGKTTVLASLMQAPLGRYGITGIGRDGESTDVVFGTDKPRIFVPKGTLVATASELLKECSCTRRILAATSINTPLGEVVVFRAEDEGFVQIAGPSIVSQLVTVREKLREWGAEKVIVDGALGRKTFSACSLADAAILVSGASYTPDMTEAVEEAAFIARTFALPVTDEELPTTDAKIFYEDKTKTVREPTKDDLAGATKILLSGALTDGLVSIMAASGKLTVVIEDPGKIVCGREKTKKFLDTGNEIKVVRRPVLAAICTNAHSVKGYSYDAYAYAKAMKERTGLLVIDVKNEIVL